MVKIWSVYDADYVSSDYDTVIEGESLTQQHFKDECDINNIMKRYAETGVFPVGDRRPLFGDFSSVPSYEDACRIVDEVDDVFESLPAHVRERFQNDPSQFVTFMNDDANFDEAVSLGLCNPKETSIGEAPVQQES